MSSVQVQHKLTSLHIPFYCFKGSFDRSLNVPVSPGCLVQRIFEDCICVSLFSYQGSHLFTVVRDSLFTISLSKPFVNNFFSTFFISFSRFCCDSVAFCDSSYRIPLYFRNVNNKFRFFAKTLTILFPVSAAKRLSPGIYINIERL